MGPYYSTLLRLEEEELIEYCLATDKCVLRGGENVKEDFPMVYSIGIFHYVTAITIIVDSIIFMSGFSPFFITKLPQRSTTSSSYTAYPLEHYFTVVPNQISKNCVRR